MALSLPDPTFDDESTRRLYPTLPLFEGFPYLVTRVVPAMYHLILLPMTASELELVLLARTQWRANRLETCLVTGADRARFISADGRDALAQTPPRGGTLVTGCLKRARPFADTLELWARQHRLDAIVEACRRKDGYMFGDLTKGGRDATPDEVGRLAGTGPEGRPRGLECCQACEEWRGRCLDPSPVFPWKVMTVHRRCQNDNRCAACGGTLYERKFNANYFQPSDGHIWHVPGFCSFSHRCPTPIGARDDAPQGRTDEQAIWRDQGQDAVYGAVDGELIFSNARERTNSSPHRTRCGVPRPVASSRRACRRPNMLSCSSGAWPMTFRISHNSTARSARRPGPRRAEAMAEYRGLSPDERRPEPGDPFDARSIGAVSDGNFPGWLAQEMLSWVPKDIQERCGKRALGVPCLKLRDNTERPITISAGTNRLVGTDPHNIIAAAQDILGAKSKAGPPVPDPGTSAGRGARGCTRTLETVANGGRATPG
jgi:hypothetical protein